MDISDAAEMSYELDMHPKHAHAGAVPQPKQVSVKVVTLNPHFSHDEAFS